MALVNVQLSATRLTQRLAQFFATTTQDTERVVAEVAGQVKADTQAGWPVDSGDSKAAWTQPQKVAPLTYQISNPFMRSLLIEYGGFQGPGPGTELLPGERLLGGFAVNPGIYSRKVPSAPLRRALARSYGEMTQKIREAHQQHWGR